jgi:hypothetical protein
LKTDPDSIGLLQATDRIIQTHLDALLTTTDTEAERRDVNMLRVAPSRRHVLTWVLGHDETDAAKEAERGA